MYYFYLCTTRVHFVFSIIAARTSRLRFLLLVPHRLLPGSPINIQIPRNHDCCFGKSNRLHMTHFLGGLLSKAMTNSLRSPNIPQPVSSITIDGVKLSDSPVMGVNNCQYPTVLVVHWDEYFL